MNVARLCYKNRPGKKRTDNRTESLFIRYTSLTAECPPAAGAVDVSLTLRANQLTPTVSNLVRSRERKPSIRHGSAFPSRRPGSVVVFFVDLCTANVRRAPRSHSPASTSTARKTGARFARIRRLRRLARAGTP